MKIVFLGSFPSSFPVFSHLIKNEDVISVFVQEETCSKIQKKSLKEQFQQQNLFYSFETKDTLNSSLQLFLSENKIDVVIVNTCSVKISKEVLDLPKYGFLNIHPGKFPENRGADPIFWTLKNNEKSTAVTIHQMDANFDTGPIVLEQSTPVHFGETWGMLHSKMALLAVQAIEKALPLLNKVENYLPQSNLEAYKQKPTPKDLTINWEQMTSDEIECLVNACNPKYGGATTYYQGGEVQVLEVAPVDNPTPMFGKTPGEIIHAHPQEGIYVCCKYGQLLKITILKSDAGILTGNKYANIGMQTGHCFTTQQFVKQSIQI